VIEENALIIEFDQVLQASARETYASA